MSRVEIVIPILKTCLVGHDIFKCHILFIEFKTVAKIRCLERGFSKQLETKATSFGLLGRKDRRTKIGNLYS